MATAHDCNDAKPETPASLSSMTRVRTSFRGHEVRIEQLPREKVDDDDDDDNSGGLAWEAANVLLRWLDSHPHLWHPEVRYCAESHAAADWNGVRLLDVSSGTGLLSIGAARCGALAVATDIFAQLPTLRHNVDLAGTIAGRIHTAELRWGDDVTAGLLPSEWPLAPLLPLRAPAGPAPAAAPLFHIAAVSDVLFVALRDGLTAPLKACLHKLCVACATVFFAYEYRLEEEEEEFMRELAAEAGITVVDHGWQAVEFRDRLVRCGDSATTAAVARDLFWEAPSIRVWQLSMAE